MNKPLKYIFLPTSENMDRSEHTIWANKNGFMLHTHTSSINLTPYHLYILSDDEIKDGDWYWTGLNLIKRKHEYLNPNDKKIIATTNPELWYTNFDKVIDYNRLILNIPKISQSDIGYITNLYNGKGKEVDVEKLANECAEEEKRYRLDSVRAKINFIKGYNQCLQDNADKKFSLEDIENILEVFQQGWANKVSPDLTKVIESLTKEQPKSDTVMVGYEYFTPHTEVSKRYKPKLKEGCIVIARN